MLYKNNRALNKVPQVQEKQTEDQDFHKRPANNKEDYRLFFEHDITGDFISSVNGELLNCNPAFLKLFGFDSLEKAIGFNLTSLYKRKSDRKKILDLLSRNKIIKNYEYEMIRLDGRTIQLIANIFGVFDKTGDLIKLHGYIFDNTERKKAEDNVRKLTLAVEQSPVSIAITDLQGNLEYVNQKFVDITGYNREESIGKNPSILKSGLTTPTEYNQLWAKLSEGKTWSGEFLNKKKSGELFWESAIISPIRNDKNEITHFLGVKEDITEKKHFEQELIAAKEKAEESDRLKSSFLSTMSHELRTPLNAIIGFSNLADDISFEEMKELNKLINKSGIHLLKIIESIFDFSAIESGYAKLKKEEIELQVVFNYLEDFIKTERAIRNKGDIELLFKTQNSNLNVSIDNEKLSKVLVNLLLNALIYTKQGSIELGYKINDEKDLSIYIKDTGIGIPENMHESIFDRFRRVNETFNNEFEGIGIGLAISKKLVELMGGSIHLDSTLGVGSTFSVYLPNCILQKRLNQKKEFGSQFGYDFSDYHILVVEDDPTNYLYLEILLKRLNTTILWAQNGFEALSMAKHNAKIDLVLMDLRIPELDGFEATREIKKIRPSLPVLAVSAYNLSSDKEKALSAGCDSFLSKPIDSPKLLATIQNYLMN